MMLLCASRLQLPVGTEAEGPKAGLLGKVFTGALLAVSYTPTTGSSITGLYRDQSTFTLARSGLEMVCSGSDGQKDQVDTWGLMPTKGEDIKPMMVWNLGGIPTQNIISLYDGK